MVSLLDFVNSISQDERYSFNMTCQRSNSLRKRDLLAPGEGVLRLPPPLATGLQDDKKSTEVGRAGNVSASIYRVGV